ncbi:zf-CCHC and Asp protease 2 and rve domain containing ing protein [Penaeus vannamei]|uniref:RNA-directed DNA polymerase n=1 Tax=Penaeus vannamei TaxID=6689 RepID=A0A3R7M625_PENVA|nr:zf-CCHC and Asp protease 2 and rve domain containing ing protein [Penaeus vannamei]
MVNGFKTQCFVDTGSEVVLVEYIASNQGRYLLHRLHMLLYLLLYRLVVDVLSSVAFLGMWISHLCSVVTQTPVGVDQSGSSTDCPEDVQLKDAELGDLLSEIDLGHLTLEQQQQLRQLSRAVAATELHNRDPDDLRRHQLEDPLWKEVIEYLEERNLPRRRLPLTLEEFELRDGVLYHVRHLPDRVLHQLVVPKTLRGSAMHLAHSSATAGHPGVYRTYCKLRDYFYFPNMLAAVKEYVGTCRSCQKRKGMAYRAPLAAAPQASYPLERVSADLMELEVTSQGNRYVLAFIDQLTRYVQLIPLPSKDAETVADAFINQFVTVMDELLPYVRLAMNSAVHRSVGDQPLYLLTGHIGTYPVGNSNYEETDHEAAQSFAARLRRAREIAVETSVQAREGWARDYNRRTRKSTFAAEVGDLVLFKDLPRMAGAGRRGALGPRWFGPARICKKTGPVTRLTGSRRMILQLLSWLPFADLLTMSLAGVMFLVLYGPFESIRSVEPFLRRVVDVAVTVSCFFRPVDPVVWPSTDSSRHLSACPSDAA